jgi:hypothetical protein
MKSNHRWVDHPEDRFTYCAYCYLVYSRSESSSQCPLNAGPAPQRALRELFQIVRDHPDLRSAVTRWCDTWMDQVQATQIIDGVALHRDRTPEKLRQYVKERLAREVGHRAAEGAAEFSVERQPPRYQGGPLDEHHHAELLVLRAMPRTK